MNMHPKEQTFEIATWLLMAILMITILKVHLLPALLSGLLVFALVHLITPYIEKKIPGKYSKWLAVMLLASLIVSLLVGLVMGILALIRTDSGGFSVMINQLAAIVEDSRKILPPWIETHLPSDAVALQQAVTEWLRAHSSDWEFIGKEAGHHIAHMLIAMVIGGMVALHDVGNKQNNHPLARNLQLRVSLFSGAFKNIVFAQVKISAINATFTGIYLALILPLLGIQLPFTKTMIAITFLVGLLPVIGNLISNTVIVIISMSHSFAIAIGSLIFLVAIHKFEYFLNARIVGGQIRAYAWELLCAMLLMEASFGLPGIVAAPIYYAYIKSECRLKQWV